MMRISRPASPRAPARRGQRGLTLFGLLGWAVLVGFVGYVTVRVVPTVIEYYTIVRMVGKVASGSPTTVAEARADFDRQRQIDYTVTAVTGADLVVKKENDRVVIEFGYDKEIPLFGPAFLLIKYRGSSR